VAPTKTRGLDPTAQAGAGRQVQRRREVLHGYTDSTDSIPDLRISHVGYERKHAKAEDPNTWFPLRHLHDAVKAGRISALTPLLVRGRTFEAGDWLRADQIAPQKRQDRLIELVAPREHRHVSGASQDQDPGVGDSTAEDFGTLGGHHRIVRTPDHECR
jgi:hypothetical protein